MAHPVNGKWQLVSSEGLLTYYKSCGLSDPTMEAKAAKLETPGAGGPTEIISFDGTNLTLVITRPDGTPIAENKGVLNQEAAAKSLDQRDIKVMVTLEGNTLVRKETGDGYTATLTRCVDGDSMTVVMDSGKGKCTRVYKRI